MAEQETAKVRYVGPHLAVEVPALGRIVERGEAVEVPLDLAAALTLQADWQAVGKSADPIAAAQEAAAPEQPAQEG
ncbi:MAG: hypothetical protein ACTHMP_13365 [Thermomicrobiales bacterium]